LISSLHGLNNTISAPVVLGSDTRVSGPAPVRFTGGITGAHALTVANSVTATNIQVDSLQINGFLTIAVPEPSVIVLLGMAIMGLFIGIRRRLQ
jgi:uncharacterized membrane protein SpoIIM required for sporulation